MNDIEKAIENLKMENELMQFDPNTGEDYPIELQNEVNQDIYKANIVAIEALEQQIKLKDYIEWLEYVGCTDLIEIWEVEDVLRQFLVEVEE